MMTAFRRPARRLSPAPAQAGGARLPLLVLLACIALVAVAAVFIRTGPHPLLKPRLDPPQVARGDKPNLLVIMVDDLDQPMFDLLLDSGWLPHIRGELVDHGTRYANSYVSDPVCCPSRATYFTGQYVQNHGILSVTKGVAYWYLAAENREDRVLPVMLREAGYYTGHIGKYLNGYGMFSSKKHVPKGYDEWYGLVDPTTYDMVDYSVNRWKRRTDAASVDDFHADMRSGADYQTDKLGDWALEFLDGAEASGQPFYLTLKPVAPHIETVSFRDDPALGYRAVFRESIRPAPRHECLVRRFMPEFVAQAQPGDWCERALPDSMAFLGKKPSFNTLDPGKHPRLEQVLQKLTAEGGDLGALERQHQMRMASLLAVDDLVGRVVERLRADGVLDDTLIVFTSDNGYFHGEHGLNSKLLPYEESIRVPLVIRAPHQAQAVTLKDMALNNDLAPTLADYGGAHPLREDDAFDGRSLRPTLLAQAQPLGRQQFLIEHYIEATSMELAAELPIYKDLSETVTQFLGKLSGIEFGALGNLSYPAYKALRRQVDGENFLYVQWYSELSNRPQAMGGEWKTDFEELYDLDHDAFEQVNVAPLAIDGDDARLKGALARLRGDLEAFKGCKAQACRTAEDR